MATLVLLEVRARDDSVEELMEFFKVNLPDTRSFDGCQDITGYLNEDGQTIVMVEHWDSKDHYQKYIAWREETGVLAAIGEMVEGAPVIRFFEPIAA